MSRLCPECRAESMTEVAGELHCLGCGFVLDTAMEAWDTCEARVAELEFALKVADDRLAAIYALAGASALAAAHPDAEEET